MNKAPLAAAVAMLLAAGPGMAAAQSSAGATDQAVPGPGSRGTVLDTVTVAGTRTETTIQDNPVSVSVIDRHQIEEEAPESVAELLRDLPGVAIVDASVPGMKRISIRGESSRRITILVDGQEITDHSTYGTPLLVDVANIERIDVVRGPASVLYGAKAIGGVINIITRRGAERPLELEAGGSWHTGTRGHQGWAAVSGTSGALDYRLMAGGDRHKDRKIAPGIYSDTRHLEGSAYENGEVFFHLGYTLGERQNHYLALKAQHHTLESDFWSDPSTFDFPVTDFTTELPKRDLTRVGLHYDGHDLGPVLRKVHVDVYHQRVDRLFANHITMQPTPMANVRISSTSDDRNVNYGGTAQLDFQLHPDHYTIIGLYHLTDELDTDKSTETASRFGPMPPMVEQEFRRDRASIRTSALFVKDDWTLTDTLQLSGGFRYDRVTTGLDWSSEPIRPDQRSHTRGNLVKSLGLTRSDLGGGSLRAMYSEGYIMPTLLQLFTDSAAGRGVVTYGNPGLDPEKSRNVEIGYRIHEGGLLLDANIYMVRARDYITYLDCRMAGGLCPQDAVPGSWINVNADRARTRGLELLAEYLLPGTAFTTYFSGAWAQRTLSIDGQSLADSSLPRLSGRLGLRYDGSMGGTDVWADAFVRAATHSRQILVADGSNTLVTEGQVFPGWATLNLSAGTAFGPENRHRLSLHLGNLLNRSYRASMDELPGMGRNAVLSFQLVF